MFEKTKAANPGARHCRPDCLPKDIQVRVWGTEEGRAHMFSYCKVCGMHSGYEPNALTDTPNKFKQMAQAEEKY